MKHHKLGQLCIKDLRRGDVVIDPKTGEIETNLIPFEKGYAHVFKDKVLVVQWDELKNETRTVNLDRRDFDHVMERLS